jgi:hypothetical protein
MPRPVGGELHSIAAKKVFFLRWKPFLYCTTFQIYCEFLHMTKEKKEGLMGPGPLF